MATKTNQVRDLKKERTGWLQVMLIMLAFPLLFFLCVFSQFGWAGLLVFPKNVS